MRRFYVFIAALGFATGAFAQPVTAKVSTQTNDGGTTQSIDSTTGNQPINTGDGVDVQYMKYCLAWVSAPPLYTLSGAGTVRLWYYNTTVGRWAENMTVFSTNATTGRDAVTEAFPIGIGTGRMYAEARSLTAGSDGGANGAVLTVRLVCWK